MSLARLHRRLAVLTALAALVAFASSAGVEPVPAALAGAVLVVALAWTPSESTGAVLGRIALAAALVLAARALFRSIAGGGDVVVPVVDLLLLLLATETLRPLPAGSETRIHALAFALLLASTAYRPGVAFAPAFVAFVVLATASLLVGHLRGRADEEATREVPDRRTLATMSGALAAAVLAASIVVFVAFPRVSRGWANRGRGLASSVAGFSDAVSLAEHGARIRSNPEIVLRVEFPDGRPPDVAGLHWRGRSYDRFDGIRWSRSRDLPLSSPRPHWYDRRWPGPERRTEIYAAPLDSNVLFSLHPVVAITAKPGIHPLVDNAGDLRYLGSGMPVYTVVSRTGRPPPDSLRDSRGRLSPSARHYLRLPELPDRVAALADSLVAGSADRYERVRRIRDWLAGEFAYTRELPATAGEATLEHFLFERRAGHCEYFSTAMAVLLRSVGIPARNVNGFLGGDWNEFGGYLAVTQNDAHSWVEAWFPGYGWVPFDPTPAGSGEGGSAAGGFWPGRFLVDGLQHGWSKWVLDYDPDVQTGLLGRAREMVAGASSPRSDEGSGDGFPLPGGWLVVGGLLTAAAATVVLRRLLGGRGEGRGFATRLYLAARRAYRRKGFPVPSSVPPLGFLRELERAGAPGRDDARRLVRLYLALRFGDREPGDAPRAAMEGFLDDVRRALDGR